MINYIAPHKLIAPEFKPLDAETEAKWGHIHHDPKVSHHFTPKTAVMWASEQERARESIQ
jgi:alpha-beta hydrolase superfamily lysophospholipase